MGLKPRADYELAAALIASGLTYAQAAKQCGGISPESLRQGLTRRGATAYRLRAPTIVTPRSETTAAKVAKQASEILRQSLGNTLAKHAAALEQVPAKANLQHIKDFGEAIEPLARTGKIVHDWGNDEPQTVVQIGLVGGWDSHQDALEVSASVTPATTDSVQCSDSQTSTPQEQQQPNP